MCKVELQAKMDTLKKHASSTNHIAKKYLTQLHENGQDNHAMTYWPRSLLEKRRNPFSKKTKELQKKNMDDVMARTMLEQSSSKTCSLDKGYFKILDVNKILSPGDEIDLTKAIIFDADKLSTAETADGHEKRVTLTVEANEAGDTISYKPIEQLILRTPIPMKKPATSKAEKADSVPSTSEVENVDFDTFVLDQKNVAETEQSGLIFYFVLKSFVIK